MDEYVLTPRPCSVLTIVIFLQFEVLTQFFMGKLDDSDRYCDEHRLVAFRYCTSFGGFWFDFITSLPWSFNDLYSYKVIVFVVSPYFRVFLQRRLYECPEIFLSILVTTFICVIKMKAKTGSSRKLKVLFARGPQRTSES